MSVMTYFSPEKLYFSEGNSFYMKLHNRIFKNFKKHKQFYNDYLWKLHLTSKIRCLGSVCVIYFLTHLPFLLYYFKTYST